MAASPYSKALSSLEKSAPSYDVWIQCIECDDYDSDTRIELTKRNAMEAFISCGWTFDSNGQWHCFECEGKRDA